MFLVLLTICSLVLDDLFLVVFIPSYIIRQLSEPLHSLYAIVFDGLGFVPCSLYSTFYGRVLQQTTYFSFSGDWLERFILCDVLQIMNINPTITHSYSNSVYHTEASSFSSSPSEFSGRIFLPTTLFKTNYRFSTAESAASSKSMSSSSIKRWRFFLTLRCSVSCLLHRPRLRSCYFSVLLQGTILPHSSSTYSSISFTCFHGVKNIWWAISNGVFSSLVDLHPRQRASSEPSRLRRWLIYIKHPLVFYDACAGILHASRGD